MLENCHSPTQPSNNTVPLMTESFQTNLNKIDECDVPSYNQFDLNKLYYQNPGKVIPILETIINAPNTDKKSINKLLKFKDIIRQNKTK